MLTMYDSVPSNPLRRNSLIWLCCTLMSINSHDVIGFSTLIEAPLIKGPSDACNSELWIGLEDQGQASSF